MEIDAKIISTKSELLNIIKEGTNPLEYIKTERDIDFVSNSLIIEENDEDPYYEESAEIVLKAIIYYLIYTENEEKTLDRCKQIAKVGIDDSKGMEKIQNILDNEEHAKTLYVFMKIASERTRKSIFEKLNERLSKI